MCGMKIVAVGTDAKGNINIEELKKAAESNKDNLSALMVLCSHWLWVCYILSLLSDYSSISLNFRLHILQHMEFMKKALMKYVR